MSFPYDLDLIYGSEKVTADPIGRLSFGKPIIVGNKVIFRSSLYPVSNDYIMSPNIDEPGWYPSFNDETIKNAYTEFEFDREAFNKIGSIDAIDGLANLYIKSTEDTQFFLSYLYLTFLIDDGESLYTKGGSVFLSDVDLTKIDPTDMTDPFFESFLLTTLHTHLYFQDHDDETGSPYFSESIPCTIRTVIEGKENNDSTYIPVIMNGSELIPVEEVIDYTHRTAVFYATRENGTGELDYDNQRVYFNVLADVFDKSENSEAIERILNHSVFNIKASGKSVLIEIVDIDGLRTFKEDGDVYYRAEFISIPLVVSGDSPFITLNLYKVTVATPYYDEVLIGQITLRLMRDDTDMDIESDCTYYLNVKTEGTCIEKK